MADASAMADADAIQATTSRVSWLAERQEANECGLYTIRNVLRPYRDAVLPTRAGLFQEARSLETRESDIRSESSDEDELDGSLCCCAPLFPCCCKGCCGRCCAYTCACCCKNSWEDDAERADSDGNFGIEVLMRAVAQQTIGGSQVLMEYWGGRHRELSRRRELGFILGNGDHWWCIRRCGEDLKHWEEIDSASSNPRKRHWNSCEKLVRFLDRSQSKYTILVLYPEDEDFEFTPDLLSESDEEERHVTCRGCWC
eukprot:TRINITY_DN63490_c0_g1_i1.p1 TRINITY_DN63490_c0_g1~~TRINITY_DN63490_c0_g1_i1.p1  ORF type:complete len:265 (-),score=40.80 TRINITY_DN63490_c0_g1_i1:97-864(-)